MSRFMCIGFCLLTMFCISSKALSESLDGSFEMLNIPLSDTVDGIGHGDLIEYLEYDGELFSNGVCKRKVEGIEYAQFTFNEDDKYGASIGVVIAGLPGNNSEIVAMGREFGTHYKSPDSISRGACDEYEGGFHIEFSDPYVDATSDLYFFYKEGFYYHFEIGYRYDLYRFKVDGGFFVYGSGLCSGRLGGSCSFNVDYVVTEYLRNSTGIEVPRLKGIENGEPLGATVESYFVSKNLDIPKCDSLYLLHREYLDLYVNDSSLSWSFIKDWATKECYR